MSSHHSPLAQTMSLPDAFAVACKVTGPLVFRTKHRTTGVEQTHEVRLPFALIGRSQAANVRLDDPTVSQTHAYLQVLEGAPYLLDLGSRAGVVWPSGSRGRGWVVPGHALRIGMFDVAVVGRFRPPAEHHPEASMDSGPALTPAAVEVHRAGNPVGAPHALDRPLTLLGRHPLCDLRLLDDSVGYFHGALVNTSDGVWFVDTLNRQGAVLNGRVCRLGRVREGDLLELGQLSLIVRVGADALTRLSERTTAVATTGGAVSGEPLALVSKTIADSVAGMMVPITDMMKQFQQCFVGMAQMFAAMQRDHTALVGEQLRQMQALAEELRELRTAPAPPQVTVHPPAASPPVTHTPPPVAKPSAAPHDPALADAHDWFMDRLASKGPPPPV